MSTKMKGSFDSLANILRENPEALGRQLTNLANAKGTVIERGIDIEERGAEEQQSPGQED